MDVLAETFSGDKKKMKILNRVRVRDRNFFMSDIATGCEKKSDPA